MAAGVVPARRERAGRVPVRVVPGLLERLLVQRCGRGVVEDEDVVRLDVEPADAEVRGAAQHLQGGVAALLDHHLVVREALEMADLDLGSLLGEPGVGLRLARRVRHVAGGVVEVQAQPRAEPAELLDYVGFVEVVREDIE